MFAHIVRLDQGNTHGWQVRVGKKRDPKRYDSKLFSDSLNGGKRKARQAAEDYLRSVLEERGIHNFPIGRRVGMQFIDNPKRVSRNNTSGRTGVYRSVLRRVRGGKAVVQPYWAAHYSIGPDGEHKKGFKRFFFGQRSEREARRLAIQFREGWEKAFLDGGVKGVKLFFREWDAAET